jgi:hypothetical protein
VKIFNWGFIPAVEAGVKWSNRIYSGVFVDLNYAVGFKLGYAVGVGDVIMPKEPKIKPEPLLGD